jgi:hypothetical protein
MAWISKGPCLDPLLAQFIQTVVQAAEPEGRARQIRWAFGNNNSVTMKTLRHSWLLILILFGWFSPSLDGQTATVVADNEAVQHVGQQATVEGMVVKVFTSKNGNTFLNFGAAYPNQTFTGWIPKDSPVSSETSLSALEGKKVRITGTIDLYKGKPEIKIMSKSQIEE